MKKELAEFHKEHEDSYWWFIARRLIIKAVLSKIKFKNQNNQILEVGCGSGGNLNLLKEYGNVSAVEHDKSLIKISKKRGFNVLEGSLPHNLPKFPHKFDLIALFDVLEHVKDEQKSIHNLANLLNQNGYIIITVPAFQFLWSKHDESNNHYKRYDIKTISNLLAQNGFKIVYSSYFFFFLSPLIIMLKKFFNYNNPAGTNPIIKKSLILIGLFEACLIKLAKLPFGTSAIILAKKS